MKMSTIKDKAMTILNEKNNKIIPENIKSGVQVFDVTGTYKGSGVDYIEYAVPLYQIIALNNLLFQILRHRLALIVCTNNI